MEKKKYSQFLTNEDKLNISFTQNKGQILEFSVNYSAEIGGKWRYIMRIDNCHGKPHKHLYYLHRRQFKVVLDSDTNSVFTWAKKYILRDFQKIKENYIRVKPKI